MNQIAFNSLAVVVFVVTFSILLGPFLQISPAIPAVVAFTILSFLTLDTLGFQGRGLSLVLDWFAQKSPLHQARVLHHEAGHFLAAHLLGIPITGYTLSAWEALQQSQAGQGGVAFDCRELTAGTASLQLLDRYCTVWMAGVVAETLVYGTFEGGADDRQKIKDIWTRLRQNYQQKEHAAALQARSLLKEHWNTYEALIKAMEQRASVVECCQIIERSLSQCD